jgi:hypothetical protein
MRRTGRCRWGTWSDDESRGRRRGEATHYGRGRSEGRHLRRLISARVPVAIACVMQLRAARCTVAVGHGDKTERALTVIALAGRLVIHRGSRHGDRWTVMWLLVK